MANNTDSNITRQVMKAFIPAFEAQRVLSKTVDTQMFKGKFTPASGDYVDIKRPHSHRVLETAGGDVSGSNPSPITSGKATATVQNYITVLIDWTNKEEALSLDQLTEILSPAAQNIITRLETNLGTFMIENAGLSSGAPGTAIDAWLDVAKQMALMKSLGVPEGEIYSVMNPFNIAALANVQKGIYAADKLVTTAWERAQLSSPMAGLTVLGSNALSSFTNTTAADLAGALTSAPDATYATAKDTMTQSWVVEGFSNDTVVKAGSVLEVTGKYHVNPLTGQTVIDESGTAVKFRAVVTADVTLNGSGAGTLVVAGAAIYEASGAYNTVNAALAGSDVVTILGSTGALYQPNLFFHKSAFSVAFVKLPKLYSTDTVAWTKDGIAMRVSKYSLGDNNTQTMRIDLLPAFCCCNPFFAGKGFGFS